MNELKNPMVFKLSFFKRRVKELLFIESENATTGSIKPTISTIGEIHKVSTPKPLGAGSSAIIPNAMSCRTPAVSNKTRCWVDKYSFIQQS